MATTYKILHYLGPIHTLRRWCQEMLAYSFACIHRTHKMMIDVDYMSRLHNNLVRQHMILANALSVADRSARPCAYKEHTWDYVLSKGKYSIKPSTKLPTEIHNYSTNEPHLRKLRWTKRRLSTAPQALCQ